MDRELEKTSVLELKLPEIEGRSPYTPPTSHLVKAGANAKAEHMARWCQEVSGLTGMTWCYLKVSQGRFALFLKQGPDTRSFQRLTESLEKPLDAGPSLC